MGREMEITEEEWSLRNRKYYPWASDDQWFCIQLLEVFYGGFHHMRTKNIKEFGSGVCYSQYNELATYDFDSLTRLVKLAHDRCVRISIGPSGPGMLKLMLHRRIREGHMFERHPTWEQIKC